MSIRQGCMHLCDKIKLHICSLSALLAVKLSNHPLCLRCHRWFLLRSFSWAFLIVITRMAAHFLSLKINTKSQKYRFIYDSLLLLLSCEVQGFYNKALHSYSCSKVSSVYETWAFFVPMINSDEVLQSIQMPWSEIGKIFVGYVPYSHMVVTVFFLLKWLQLYLVHLWHTTFLASAHVHYAWRTIFITCLSTLSQRPKNDVLFLFSCLFGNKAVLLHQFVNPSTNHLKEGWACVICIPGLPNEGFAGRCRLVLNDTRQRWEALVQNQQYNRTARFCPGKSCCSLQDLYSRQEFLVFVTQTKSQSWQGRVRRGLGKEWWKSLERGVWCDCVWDWMWLQVALKWTALHSPIYYLYACYLKTKKS